MSRLDEEGLATELASLCLAPGVAAFRIGGGNELGQAGFIRRADALEEGYIDIGDRPVGIAFLKGETRAQEEQVDMVDAEAAVAGDAEALLDRPACVAVGWAGCTFQTIG